MNRLHKLRKEKKEASDIFFDVKGEEAKLETELENLEAKANILEKAKKIKEYNVFMPSALAANSRFGSNEFNDLEKFDQEREENHINNNLRKLYFSIPDQELRRAVMEKIHEIEEHWIKKSSAWVKESQIDLFFSKRLSWGWMITPILLLLIIVPYAYSGLGAGAGLACLGIILLIGIADLEKAKIQREENIKMAEETLGEATESHRSNVNRKSLFSLQEIESGKPEEKL